MPFEDDADDDWPPPDRLLPPEDRLWRHPSEMAASAGDGVTADRIGPPRAARARRLALAGTVLIGAAAVFGVTWLAAFAVMQATRSTDVTRQREPYPAKMATTRPGSTPVAVTSDGSPLTESAAATFAPAVARVEARHGDTWTTSSALWIDDDGTLVLPAGPVATADEVRVAGTDGTRQPATLVGIDEATALAVLTVSHTAGSPVEATSEPADAGQNVTAIGCGSRDRPDQQATVTMTPVVIRSMDQRAMVDGTLLHGVMHLDRPLPGDIDGGGLVDHDGHLIGLILGNADDQRVSTVIPASTAIDTARALRTDGHIERAWLGVRAVDVDLPRATMLHITGGARVTEVTAGSPAAAAGLQPDDVVVAVGDQPIGNASELVLALRTHQPSTRVTITVHRGPDQLDVPVTLGG